MTTRALAVGVAVILALATGCVDASRLNYTCQWSDTTSGRLELSRTADREHLRADVEVAWEIGMRAADIRYRDVPSLSNPIRRACRNTLLDSIKVRHGVSNADLDHAWGWRIWWADIISVLLPMALLTAIAMDRVARRVRTGLRPSGQLAVWGVALLAVAVVGLLSVGAAQIWGITAEQLRIRDNHIAARAFVVPVVAHDGIAYACALVLCFGVTIWRLTRAPSVVAQRNRFSRQPSWRGC